MAGAAAVAAATTSAFSAVGVRRCHGGAAAEAEMEPGYPRDPADPRRRLAPACARNKQPILEVLRAHLPADASPVRILEVASGTGEHAAHFAAALPHVAWQPTEYNGCAGPHLGAHQDLSDICESIVAFTEGLPNVAPPRELDAAAAVWPAAGEGGQEPPQPWDAIIACNVTHISPTAVTEGIASAAGRLLRPGGKLLIYGPFAERGRPLSEGNAKFDASLQARGRTWGLREAEWVCEVAKAAGLRLAAKVEMPEDKLTLVFERV